MAGTRKSSTSRSVKPSRMVTGRTLAKLGPGVQLVKVGRTAKRTVPKEHTASVLVRKLAKALSKPGIDKSYVFGGPNPSKVYAYSVDVDDPTRIVRRTFDGKRVVGRFVDGKFRACRRASKSTDASGTAGKYAR